MRFLCSHKDVTATGLVGNPTTGLVGNTATGLVGNPATGLVGNHRRTGTFPQSHASQGVIMWLYMGS